MFVKMLLLFGSYISKFTLVLWVTNEYTGGYGTIYKAQSRTGGTGFVIKCKELSIQFYAFLIQQCQLTKYYF
ncbi:hypothetical protein Hanom_Chr03g00238551 [Helianthus anomalus]